MTETATIYGFLLGMTTNPIGAFLKHRTYRQIVHSDDGKVSWGWEIYCTYYRDGVLVDCVNHTTRETKTMIGLWNEVDMKNLEKAAGELLGVKWTDFRPADGVSAAAIY